MSRKATNNRLKSFAIALIMTPVLALVALGALAPPAAVAVANDEEAAATYKAKCAMCHGAKADKKFDASKSDDELLQIVLKGGRPGMPAYETKGINEEQAKAIIAHMKTLKQ